MKYFALLIVLFTLPTFAQDVSFAAEANPTKVAIGEPFQISFRLLNEQSSNFNPPSFKDFSVIQSNQQQFSQYAHGRSTVVQEWVYSLVANKAGKYKIGAARVLLAGGRKLDSQPIDILVTDELGAAESPLGDQLILRMTTNKENVVVGEQLTIVLKIYYGLTKSISSVELLKRPELSNMFSRQIQSSSYGLEKEKLNGKMYTCYTLEKIVAFPNKSGPLELSPAVIRAKIRKENPNIFGYTQLVPYNLHSNSVTVHVSELDSAPGDFDGAIGNYTLQADLNQNTIKADEVLQFTIRIKGDGDIKQVMPPKIGLAKEDFEIYPPNTQEKLEENNGLLGGTKIFEYIIVPKNSDAMQTNLSTSFVFYDPTQKQFVQRDTSIPIQIVASKRLNTLPPNVSEDRPARDSSEVVLSLGEPQIISNLSATKTNPFWGSILFWLSTAVPFLSLGVVFGIERLRAALKKSKRIKSAERETINHRVETNLRAAKQLLKTNHLSKFYSCLADTLLAYASNVLEISNTQLTKRTIQKRLENKEVSTSLIQRFSELIERCEFAAFAGSSGDNLPQNVLTETQVLLAELEREIKHAT